jgi:hypothetical protein
MMVSHQVSTTGKAIRKPGKSGPAVFAFWDPGPPLRDFTKNISVKANPPAFVSPPLGSRTEGFAKPMSSEPAPSHRPWISVPGATPACRALPYHAGFKVSPGQQDFISQADSSFLPNQCAAGKTTLECQTAREKAQTGGCYRSTEFLIVVPRASWRKIFLQKTSHGQKERRADKDLWATST